MRPQNLHTHTCFCDGKNTPAQMAGAAFALGCGSLGFSGHSYLAADPGWTMQPEDMAQYRQQVLALRQQYAGKMDIYLGLEQDYFSEKPDPGRWDYLIGSVHCLEKQGVFFSVDNTRALLEKAIGQLYGGDSLALAEEYYALVAGLPQKTGCQIIGHLDLLTKFNEEGSLFDTTAPRYRMAALEAVEQLARRDMIFEINSGAISRGYRTAPYPSSDLLRAVKQAGGRICLSSDSHSVDTILFGLRDSAALAQACGFQEAVVLTAEGFRPVPLRDMACPD